MRQDGIFEVETEAGEIRPWAIGHSEIRIAFEDNLFVLRLLHEAKRAGADRMAGKVGASVRGNDADGGRNEIHAERSVRLGEMKNDRGVVRRFDGGDHAKGAAFWGFVGGTQDEIEGRFDIGGG